MPRLPDREPEEDDGCMFPLDDFDFTTGQQPLIDSPQSNPTPDEFSPPTSPERGLPAMMDIGEDESFERMGMPINARIQREDHIFYPQTF